MLLTKRADGEVLLSEAADGFAFGVAVAGRCDADVQPTDSSSHEPNENAVFD
jgi:hypothetical protein